MQITVRYSKDDGACVHTYGAIAADNAGYKHLLRVQDTGTICAIPKSWAIFREHQVKMLFAGERRLCAGCDLVECMRQAESAWPLSFEP